MKNRIRTLNETLMAVLGIVLLLSSAVCGSAQYSETIMARRPKASGGSPTFVETCYQPGTTSPYTTASQDTTGAKFIAFALSQYFGSVPSITDNKSNGTATPLTQYGASGIRETWEYYAVPSVGTGHTFTVTSGSYVQFCVYAISNVTGVYDTGTDAGNGAAGTSCQPTVSINPGAGTHLVLTAVAESSHTTTNQTIDSSYVLDEALAGSSGVYISLATAHLIQTPGAATQPTWSSLSSGSSCAIMSIH